MKQRKKGYGLLMGLTILFTLAAISTLIPEARVSKACMLGYKAHCTFTPISTVICAVLAAAVCRFRSKHYVMREAE